MCYENGNVSNVAHVNDLAYLPTRRGQVLCIISLSVSLLPLRLCRVMIMTRGCRWWSCWLRCLEPRTLSWLRRTNHSGSVTWAGGFQRCGYGIHRCFESTCTHHVHNMQLLFLIVGAASIFIFLLFGEISVLILLLQSFKSGFLRDSMCTHTPQSCRH